MLPGDPAEACEVYHLFKSALYASGQFLSKTLKIWKPVMSLYGIRAVTAILR